MEDIRLGRADGRQPAVTEHLGANYCCLADADGICVLCAGGNRLATVLGVADNGTFRSTFGQTQLQADGTAAIGNATQPPRMFLAVVVSPVLAAPGVGVS